MPTKSPCHKTAFTSKAPKKRPKQDYRMQMYMGEREREREDVWEKIFTINQLIRRGWSRLNRSCQFIFLSVNKHI